MAYGYVGSASNALNVPTITYSPTAGNYLVVVSETSTGAGNPVASIADNAGGTWTTRKATVNDGTLGNYFSVFTCSSAATGVVLITLTFAGGTPGNTNLSVIEYSGLSATGWQGISAFKEQVTPGAAANAITSNSLSVSAQPALLLGWVVEENANGGTTVGTSPIAFTGRITGGAVNMLEDARVTSTGSVIATATSTGHGAADTFMSYVMAISEPASGGGGGGTTQSMPINCNFSPQGNTFAVTTNGTGNTASAQLVSFDPVISSQPAAQASGISNCPPQVCVANLGTAVVYVSFTSALRSAVAPGANPSLELPVFPGISRVFTLQQTPNVGSATPYAIQINTISASASQPLLVTFGEEHLT
jgi:hypothetical protein